MSRTGIEVDGGRWYLFGAPPEIVAALKAEAEERDDPLLGMWAEGQEAGRRTHDFYDRHKSFDGVSNDDMVRPHALRQEAVIKYAFSVTHRNALQRIAEFADNRGIVSLGAGTGWWEHRLAVETGLDVLAYDIAPPGDSENTWYADVSAWCDVQRGDVTTLAAHTDRALLLSWPPYGDPFAKEALDEWERAGGTRLIYIGETYGGCCADDDFFAAVGQHYDDECCEGAWKMVDTIGLPQWMGIHDEVWCLERG